MADIQDDVTVSAEPVYSAPTFRFTCGTQIFGSNFAFLSSFNL